MTAKNITLSDWEVLAIETALLHFNGPADKESLNLLLQKISKAKEIRVRIAD